jgi:hypothetical protein
VNKGKHERSECRSLQLNCPSLCGSIYKTETELERHLEKECELTKTTPKDSLPDLETDIDEPDIHEGLDQMVAKYASEKAKVGYNKFKERFKFGPIPADLDKSK